MEPPHLKTIIHGENGRSDFFAAVSDSHWSKLVLLKSDVLYFVSVIWSSSCLKEVLPVRRREGR